MTQFAEKQAKDEITADLSNTFFVESVKEIAFQKQHRNSKFAIVQFL